VEVLILLFVLGLLAFVGVVVALAATVGLISAAVGVVGSLLLPALVVIGIGWLLVTLGRLLTGRPERASDAEWLDS
jgi:hypothetical protein